MSFTRVYLAQCEWRKRERQKCRKCSQNLTLLLTAGRQKRIYNYEGTVRQFLVDDKGMVLIACFGLVAHENDAERATRCAMEISTDLNKQRIISSSGVTTGDVYCGLVGGENRCEYALIGDVVNMAARLMASTTDEIRCDLSTYNRSYKRVVFEKLDPIQVKGKHKKIPVFKPVAGSVSAALSLKQVPLVGRVEEMVLVSHFIDAFADLAFSSTMIFEGEAGTGKSKMLTHALEAIELQKLKLGPRHGKYEAMPNGASRRTSLAFRSQAHTNQQTARSASSLKCCKKCGK